MAGTLSRRDQENLIHAHQTAAAAKPLNQSVRALAPRTPGNHAVRRRQNDENATVGQTKGDKAKSAAITPAPTTARAPLGQKTTNAKARAFATPAPLTGGLGKTHHRSASARKQKLKVHHQVEPEAAPVSHEVDEEEPDVEYCPPKAEDLPDVPDDVGFEADKKFPQFEGENYSRGWWGLYANPVGDDGLTKFERDEKEREEKMDRDFDEQMKRDADRSWQKFNEEYEEAERYLASHPTRPTEFSTSMPTNAASKGTLALRPAPSSTKAKVAASALGKASQPRFATSTASTRARVHGVPGQAPPSPASKSTIGYARGRQVSSNLKDVNSKDETEDAPSKNLEDNPFVKERRMLDELLQSEVTEGGLDDALWEPSTGKDWFQEQVESEFVMDVPHYA